MDSSAPSYALHALQQWKASACKRRQLFQRDVLCEASTSCALVCVSWPDPETDGVRLAELLAVLALLSRPGVAPEMLHSLLLPDGDVPFAECPLTRWCSFCDGGDRLLHVRVAACSSVTPLDEALFDWDDATAPPRFRALRALLPVAERSQCPMSLTLETDRWMGSSASASFARALPAFLARHQQAVDDGTPLLFRVGCLDVSTDDDTLISTVARSGVPCAITTDSNWTWTLAPSESESEDEWQASKTLLATGNIKRATVSVPPPSDDMRLQVYRLLELLHSQPLAIKDLEYRCQFSKSARQTRAEAAEREPYVRAMANALFALDSRLRPDRLVVSGPIHEFDIGTMIDQLSNRQAPPAERIVRFRELVCEAWNWPFHRNTGSMGRTLERLLRLIGGVESLRIPGSRDTHVSVVDIVEIRSCRCLNVSVFSSSWMNVPPSTDDRVNASPLQSLTLRLSDDDDQDAIEAVARLLPRMGRSLRSLTLAPYFYGLSFGAETARAIVRECPDLETLNVGRCLTSSFVAQFVDSLATAEPCRLKHLALERARPMETVSSLVAALASPLHPLSQSLQTLRLNIGENDGDEHLLFTAIGEMLNANKRLQRVTIQCVHTTVVDHARVFAVVPAPLRCRLALLSAVRRHALPELALQTVFEMAGSRTRRLRFELLDPSSLYELEM